MPLSIDTAGVRAAIAEAELPIYKVCRARAAVAGAGQEAWDELRAITALYPAFDLEEDPTPLPGFDRLDAISTDRLKEWAVLAG